MVIVKTLTHEAWPIYAASGANEAYLVMIQEGDRLKVIPTELGKQKLDGRLWPQWLQGLLLTKSSPKLTYGVGIVGKYLYVSSSGSLNEMKFTVASLGAQIFPTEKVLVVAQYEGLRSDVLWNVRKNGRKANILHGLKLPVGAEVYFVEDSPDSPEWILKLHRKQSCRTPMRELARTVELHFALSVARG